MSKPRSLMSPEDRIKTTDFTNPLNLISEGFFDRTGGLLVPLPVQLAPTGPTRSLVTTRFASPPWSTAPIWNRHLGEDSGRSTTSSNPGRDGRCQEAILATAILSPPPNATGWVTSLWQHDSLRLYSVEEKPVSSCRS